MLNEKVDASESTSAEPATCSITTTRLLTQPPLSSTLHHCITMSQNSYEFNVTVSGHTGSITALQFSPDCKFLASGSNHGVLLIFSTSSWRPLKRLIDASPITTIIWHETERYLLLCGCESGDLYFLHLAESLVRPWSP